MRSVIEIDLNGTGSYVRCGLDSGGLSWAGFKRRFGVGKLLLVNSAQCRRRWRFGSSGRGRAADDSWTAVGVCWR